MTPNEKVNILMVDDQPGKLLTYEAILAELGENLIQVTSARDALEVLLRTDIAVVLMDVSMPEFDGFELADMIRQHPRFQKTAIIFISGVLFSESDMINGYRRGAVDYISVPVVPEVLRAKIGVFVDLHRKTRMLERLNNELEERVEKRTEELRQNVSAQIAAEERIRLLNSQLEQRVAELETIMQVLPVGVAISTDPAFSHVTTNPGFRGIFGTDDLSFPVGTGGDGKEPEQPGSPFLFMQEAVRLGKPVANAEMQLPGSEGAEKHVLASASPLVEFSGKVRGSVGVFFDVSHRKQLENALRQRAELLELASEAIMVRDMQGVIRYWNSGAESLYGWPRKEAMDQNIHHFLKTVFPVTREEVDRILRTEGSWRGNLTHTTRDGREIVVASRMALDREMSAVLEINRDITGEVRAEEALRQAEKLAAMGRMAGIIAHEINNPLEAITNTFYLLRNHPSLDSEAQHYASLAEQELQRASHITHQTLSFYRESKQPILVSLHEVIDNVLELQQRAIQSSRIALQKRYRSDAVIYGYPVELRQVFLNLISNAIQAMPDGGTLRLHVAAAVEAATGRRGVSICITDTGAGVRREDVQKLFQPFFSTKSTKGTGLGLWISKGIIQKYEGNIAFRSIFYKKKNLTCFRVFLPTDQVPTARKSAKTELEPASTASAS